MQNRPADDLSGRTLGQFEILEEIGRGGMATVYRARQKNINRDVAVKVLPRALLHDPGFYERFTREVDVIAHLEHPHILPIYDFGEVEGVPYIAMRFLGGGTMSQMIRRGQVPLETLVKPFSQIAQALEYAHHQGIIHRDLKPANILMDERGNAYLTDFGIAKVLNSNLTGSAIIGTPAYMSPEQAHGGTLDARADIYSLGVVLFELITGREPYQAETPVALLLKHINEPMPSPRIYRPDVPQALEIVVAKATAKNPNERYASAGDLADALAEAVPSTGTRNRVATRQLVDAPTIVPDSKAKMTPLVSSSPTRPPDLNSPTITPAPMHMGTVPGGATAAQAGAQPAKRRGLSPLVYVGAGVVALVAVGAIVLSITSQPPPPIYVTPTFDPAALTLPTPFASALNVARDVYSLNVPDDWAFVDLSADDEVSHVWQKGTEAYVAVTLQGAGDDFAAQIDTYVAEHFPEAAFAFIDEASAPDGTIRRSFRLFGQTEPAFQPGQTDVFFRQAGDTFAALELYASDGIGAATVPIFQQVLDSLRLNAQA
ncbi:MAG: protein kinase [Pleurocapsa minor GSE-CHR-MK-17-07R]|jgi:serine/threonine-protein kinase|nr:protein kinase [Pleurocapsa minor GSE-CHR-MK 17-07R]